MFLNYLYISMRIINKKMHTNRHSQPILISPLALVSWTAFLLFQFEITVGCTSGVHLSFFPNLYWEGVVPTFCGLMCKMGTSARDWCILNRDVNIHLKTVECWPSPVQRASPIPGLHLNFVNLRIFIVTSDI
jgi:hypothetical protein